MKPVLLVDQNVVCSVSTVTELNTAACYVIHRSAVVDPPAHYGLRYQSAVVKLRTGPVGDKDSRRRGLVWWPGFGKAEDLVQFLGQHIWAISGVQLVFFPPLWLFRY